MRRLGLLALALTVVTAVSTAPVRALDCGGRAALSPGCCCKGEAKVPSKAPCCEVAPASSDNGILSSIAVPAPAVAALAVVPEPPRAPEAVSQPATLPASPPGSPPVFLLDCTFRI